MGLASVAGSAKVKPDSVWLPAGDYALVQATALKELDKPGTLAFISDVDILVSSGDGALRPGLPGALFVDCLRFDGAFAGEVKKILAALGGTTPNEIDEATIAAAVSAQQPFVGTVMAIKAWDKPQKGDPSKSVTKYMYFSPNPELVARVPEIRAELGLPPLSVKTF